MVKATEEVASDDPAAALYRSAMRRIARARRAAEADNLQAAASSGLTIWVFCVWCGHAMLTEPFFLAAMVKDLPSILEELERRLRCQKCRRHGVKLIPTDRTLVSFDRMA
jgi:hypothetical protein